MLYNKRALSGIIVTIITIGIALVAVGVVWYTLNNVMSDQSENIEGTSENIFKSCAEAGYYLMNETHTTCSETIKYFGGQKCCPVEPTA
jgi:flagellin-like protein